MTLKEKIITEISFLLHPKKRKLIKVAKTFKSKTGIEIGGPSSFFSIKSYLPIYLYAKAVDGVNFSTNTLWEGNISEGKNFNYYTTKLGYQYIAEASDLSKIRDSKYEFILSCHSLEHVANPIKALKEWSRVTKKGGVLVLILPDKNFTFDNQRPYTSFEHLKQDFENNIDETDSTHFDEVNLLHNIDKDQGVKNREELIERTKNNFINRGVHHHVFSFEVIKQMLNYVGFEIIAQQWIEPFHLVTIAKKM